METKGSRGTVPDHYVPRTSLSGVHVLDRGDHHVIWVSLGLLAVSALQRRSPAHYVDTGEDDGGTDEPGRGAAGECRDHGNPEQGLQP